MIILRLTLLPIIWFLSIFNQKIKNQIKFERKNSNKESSRFLDEKITADYCFHVSSEGELEQVMPIINSLLSSKNRIEILFTSPSVEHKLLELYESMPENIRILRLAILTFNPIDYKTNLNWWVSAPNLIMVRYDFFPQLMSLGGRKKHFILINAALKGKNDNSLKSTLYKRKLKCFSHLIASNKTEELALKKLGLNVIDSFDFRIVQILDRLDNRTESLLHKWKDYEKFQTVVNQYTKNKRFIYGSFWVNDARLTTFDKDSIHIIVPHSLNQTDISSIEKSISHKVFIIDKNTELSKIEFKSQSPLIIILKIKGILCELYPDFSRAYVGGGFGESVHSVLEPYLSGCVVSYGPVNHRSTEVDYIKSISPCKACECQDIINLKSVPAVSDQQISFEDITLQFKSIISFFRGIKNAR